MWAQISGRVIQIPMIVFNICFVVLFCTEILARALFSKHGPYMWVSAHYPIIEIVCATSFLISALLVILFGGDDEEGIEEIS